MFNIMDIIVVLVILIAGFFGYRNGFVKTIISLLAFFIAIGLAVAFYKPLTAILIENTKIDDWIIEEIVSLEVDTNLEDEEESIDGMGSADSVGTADNTSNNNYLLEFLKNLPSSFTEDFDFEEEKEIAKQEFAEKVAELILNLLSLIVIYVVVRVTLLIAMFVANGIMQIPVLKQLNEVLGLVAGIILGVMQIYIAFAILTFIASVCDISFIIDAIKASMLAKVLFEGNIIIGLLF